jgi:hypothetical protein
MLPSVIGPVSLRILRDGAGGFLGIALLCCLPKSIPRPGGSFRMAVPNTGQIVHLRKANSPGCGARAIVTNSPPEGVGEASADREPENTSVAEPSVCCGTLGKAACGEIGAGLIEDDRASAQRLP